MAFSGEPEVVQALLWPVERQRVRERFRASLAGLLELEVLRAEHQLRVDRALERERPRVDNAGQVEETSVNEPARGYQYHVLGSSGSLKVTRSHSQDTSSDSGGAMEIWARSTWPSENLLPPQHQHPHRCYTAPSVQLRGNLAQADSKSRASSGFCDDDFSGDNGEEDSESSSLSGSCTSLDRRPLLIKRREGGEFWGDDMLSKLTVSGVIPTSGFLSVANLCPESHWSHFSSVLQAQVSINPMYCLDLVAGQSQEVYPYPSPLHAVALQSPLYASMQSPTQVPGGAGSYKFSSLPMCLTAGPRQMGCRPTPNPEKHKLEEVILDLVYCHRRHDALHTDGSSTSCFCPESATPPTLSGGWRWPSLYSPTQRERQGSGNTENCVISPPGCQKHPLAAKFCSEPCCNAVF